MADLTRPGADSRGTGRADAMARRLTRTAERLGITADGLELMLRAFQAAMQPRRERLAEAHADYLHPARTALILMDDARVADPQILATGLLAETRDRSLAATAAAIERVDSSLGAELSYIPNPDEAGDPLLERLLSLAPGHAMVAVAERLDHARHLHLRQREEWEAYHHTTCSAYAPVAGRSNEALGSRLRWWCATFRRRFLER